MVVDSEAVSPAAAFILCIPSRADATDAARFYPSRMWSALADGYVVFRTTVFDVVCLNFTPGRIRRSTTFPATSFHFDDISLSAGAQSCFYAPHHTILFAVRDPKSGPPHAGTRAFAGGSSSMEDVCHYHSRVAGVIPGRTTWHQA